MKWSKQRNWWWYRKLFLVLVLGFIFYVGIEPLLYLTQSYSNYPELAPTLIKIGKICILIIVTWGIYRLVNMRSRFNEKQNYDIDEKR